ncbi:MAG: thioredoxin family protein [Rhodothermales bacterium]
MAVESQPTELGTPAHAFDLPIANPWIDGEASTTRSLRQYDEAEVLVVVFTCNHCPYAVHVERALVALAKTYTPNEAQFVAISSNDATTHPEDRFDKMAERAREIGMPFPYLHDETQLTARAYGAVCTPDFFVYDKNRKLAYRGRFDETRPNMGTAHGGELRKVIEALLATGRYDGPQHPAMGCSIKWKRAD